MCNGPNLFPAWTWTHWRHSISCKNPNFISVMEYAVPNINANLKVSKAWRKLGKNLSTTNSKNFPKLFYSAKNLKNTIWWKSISRDAHALTLLRTIWWNLFLFFSKKKFNLTKKYSCIHTTVVCQLLRVLKPLCWKRCW